MRKKHLFFCYQKYNRVHLLKHPVSVLFLFIFCCCLIVLPVKITMYAVFLFIFYFDFCASMTQFKATTTTTTTTTNKQQLMQHLLTAKEFSTIFHCSCFSQTVSAAFDAAHSANAFVINAGIWNPTVFNGFSNKIFIKK